MNILSNNEICPNCGHQPFSSSFCPECGQRKISTRDLNLGIFLREVVNDLLNFENNFFRTLKSLFTSPGIYITSYMKGARKKYLSPIKFFILSNAIYFLFPTVNTFTTTLEVQLNGLPYSHFTNGIIEGIISSSDMTFNEFESEYNQITQILSKAMMITLPLIFAFITWVLNLKKRQDNTPIFHINYALILTGFFTLFLCSILPGVYYFIGLQFGLEGMLSLVNELNLSISMLILINIFGYFLYKGFFYGNIYTRVSKVIILNILLIPLLQFYRFILLVITMGWMEFFK